METMEDFKRGDAWQSQWEANFDNARDECMSEADNILMEVEHIVHDLDQTLDVQNTEILADALKSLRELINYRYVYPYNNEPYDYIFKEQIVQIVKDRLSYDLEVR